MDVRDIIIESLDIDNSSCEELLREMDRLEFVVIEDKKTSTFEDKVRFICLAHVFGEVMERDYSCKQIKTFLKKHWHYDDPRATLTANRLNEARRVYTRLPKIVENCAAVPYVDIRDLDMHELYLAHTLSWVLKRNAESKPKRKILDKVPVEVDIGSVEQTKRDIINSDWYQAARKHPKLVASVLSGITTFVMNDSIYQSQKD